MGVVGGWKLFIFKKKIKISHLLRAETSKGLVLLKESGQPVL